MKKNCEGCGRFMGITRDLDGNCTIYYYCNECNVVEEATDLIDAEWDEIDKQRILQDAKWQEVLDSQKDL